MKCPQCQAENADQSKFCVECGSKLAVGGEVLFTKTMTLETGYRVLGKGKVFADKYEIIGEIGQGGMGIVYKAEDINLKRTVALKFLPAEFTRLPEARERFIREAQAAAALSHPNICTIYEVEEADGQPYIAMEYVEGQSLRQRVAKGPMSADNVADIAVQVAEGLEAAHQRGIIHRDIKSANIMVTEKGQAKIMDFGLAKVMGQEQLTRESVTIGTVAYMSPEQAQGEDLDKRTDLWSFGVVLYELLTGQLPFRGDRESIILHSIVKAEPKPPRQINPDVPVELQKIIDRALKKNREDRYGSAGEIAADLRNYLDVRRAEEAGFFNLKSLARRMKRPAYFIPAAAILIALAVFAYWRIDHAVHVRWARRVALPEIQRLYQDSKFADALKVAIRAEKYIAADLEFKEALSQIDGQLAMESDPPGASVYVREYRAKEASWEFVGRTPLSAVRLAKGNWRIKMEKPGCEPSEIWYEVSGKALNNTAWADYTIKMKLDPEGSVPAGMVRIEVSPGQNYVPEIGGLKGTAVPVELRDYLLDRYEVTNRQFKAFIEGGGYREQKYWKQPFVRNGRTIPWEEAIKVFVDKTGVPAPAGWELGDYPPGQDDFPVSGVSWYEAAAYAEFAGKTLPTAYHWAYPLRQAGGPLAGAILPLSNFEGKEGPFRVGTSQAASEFGTYDQCGNVKEWCWNALGDKRLVLGGAWDQPAYMGFGSEAFEAFRRDGSCGFRCMKFLGQPELTSKAFDPIPKRVATDFSKLAPCSDEVFSVIRGIFSYTKTDLEPKVEFRREYSEYAMLEKVSFWDANKRFRVFAYIFLPRKIKPPFQTVFYYPGAHAWYVQSIFEYPLPEGALYFKHGRAFVFPVLPGMFERKSEEPEKAKTPQEARERFIKRNQDFSRCIDYVETRPANFTLDKLAYHGLSSGAGIAPIIGALEPRLKVIIAIGGGASTIRNAPEVVSGRFPPYPELDQINFLPRVKAPFFLANGKYDFGIPEETNLNVFMRLLGTPDKDKYKMLYETGHIAISPKSFKDILDFLDKYLGPVN